MENGTMRTFLDSLNSRAWVVAASVAAGASASVALADPPSPADAIRELQKTYRTTETCERVQVEVKFPAPGGAPGTRTARSAIVVRLQPVAQAMKYEGAADAGAPGQPPVAVHAARAIGTVSLDLGAIRVWASEGKLVAVHDRNPGTYVESPVDEVLSPVAIGTVIPPVILPALELASTPEDAACNRFWPYARDIVWQSVEVDPRQAGRRTIRGTCVGGTVVLTTQGQRLRSLSIDQPERRTTLTLTFSPASPCDVAKSAIDVAGRERVKTMEDLRPRSGVLRVGTRLPQMPITQAGPGGAQGWDLGGLMQPPASVMAHGVGPAEHVVLVLMRSAPAGGSGAAAAKKFDGDALAPLLAEMRLEAFKARIPAAGGLDGDKAPGALIARFGYAPVLVMSSPTPEEIVARMKSAAERWGPDVLWTTDARATIDMFAPGADAACVIIDSNFILRAVVPVEGGQTAEQVADQVAAALFELAPADAKQP